MQKNGKAAPRSIINVSSTSGTHGNAGQVNYATVSATIDDAMVLSDVHKLKLNHYVCDPVTKPVWRELTCVART